MQLFGKVVKVYRTGIDAVSTGTSFVSTDLENDRRDVTH